MMTAFNFIDDKRCGKAHSAEDIEWFIREYVNGNIADYQTSAWLMAVCINGMTDEETSALTMAMAHSGDMFESIPGSFCVDKHSTGGVGDKVTLFAAPVCAACGVYVPKMSGRGLGYTGGTIDKLEAIPGLNTSADHDKFVSIVKKYGFAVTGQTGHLVPADKLVYGLRSATATVASIPLICSSIMSKKLATGADGIVLDVKCGNGAFMKDVPSAEKLAAAMLAVGKNAGKKCTAVLTDMNKPLGKAVGNSLEVIEAIEALKGNSDENFRQVAYRISCEMLMLAGYGDENKCLSAIDDVIASGRALETFAKVIEAEGGDPRVCEDYSLFPAAKECIRVVSPRSGYIGGISCRKTGVCSTELGAGRQRKEDSIDYSAGIKFAVSVGDYVEKGQLLAELFTSQQSGIDAAADFINVFSFSENKIRKNENIIKILRND